MLSLPISRPSSPNLLAATSNLHHEEPPELYQEPLQEPDLDYVLYASEFDDVDSYDSDEGNISSDWYDIQELRDSVEQAKWLKRQELGEQLGSSWYEDDEDDVTIVLDRKMPARLGSFSEKKPPPSRLVLHPLRYVITQNHLQSRVKHRLGTSPSQAKRLKQLVNAKTSSLNLKKYFDYWAWNGNKMTGLRGSTDDDLFSNNMEELTFQSEETSLDTPPASPVKSRKRKRTPSKVEVKKKRRLTHPTIRPFDSRFDKYPGTSPFRDSKHFDPTPTRYVRYYQVPHYPLIQDGRIPEVKMEWSNNAQSILEMARKSLVPLVSEEAKRLSSHSTRHKKMKNAKVELLKPCESQYRQDDEMEVDEDD